MKKISSKKIKINANELETAYFAGGCFWGIEEYFRTQKGVEKTMAGYMGGIKENPTYAEVCLGTTGHIETVKIKFNPKKVSYKELVEKFWLIHDPTTINHQGPDYGEQYKPVIFYTSKEQKKVSEESKKNLQKSRKFPAPIVTEIKKAQKFWIAENYHQQYLKKTGKHTC